MTHTFADVHGPYEFVPRLDWLEDPANVPKWKAGIPFFLSLDEEGDDDRCREFIDYLSTSIGAVRWHMFCETAYTFPMRAAVNQINVDKVVGSVNATGNQIFTIEGAVQPQLADKVQLETRMGTMMGRLFNYYHCQQVQRPLLFKLRARRRASYSCPACGCVFGHHGGIHKRPHKDVCAKTWEFKDRLEDGGSNQPVWLTTI